MKISLYKFVTTFCLVPVTDWGAFVQRVVGRVFLRNARFQVVSVTETTSVHTSLIGLLIWSPDTIAWIFVKLGNIEMKVGLLLISAFMPEIFGEGATQYASWAELWQAGLNAIPSEIVEIINGLGVAQILGMLTSTYGAVHAIQLYRKIMLRAESLVARFRSKRNG